MQLINSGSKVNTNVEDLTVEKLRQLVHNSASDFSLQHVAANLPGTPMKHAMSDKFAFELTRLQFPIKIAFALTMNELKDSLQKSVKFYCQNTYELMVKSMLHSLDAETPTMYMYGQNSLCSKNMILIQPKNMLQM